MSATRRSAYFSTFGVAPIGSIGTCFGIEDKGNKIQYFSPDFDGFTFAVSFTPTGNQRRAGGGLSYGTDVTAPGPDDAGNNILSVGIDYTHDFEDWNLTIGGGGEWAFTQYTSAGGTTNNKPSWYQAGIQIGIGDFSIGASGAYYVDYAHAGYAATTASSGDDGWVVSGGASYTIDAWSFGLQGVFGSFQQNASAILGTSAPGISAQNEKMWGVSLNAAYALGPGISLEGQIAYTNANYGNLSGFGVSVPGPLRRDKQPRRQRQQCSFLGDRPGHRDQLLIAERARASPRPHPGRARCRGHAARSCRRDR